MCCFKPIYNLAPVCSLASLTGRYISLGTIPSTGDAREKDQLLPATAITSRATQCWELCKPHPPGTMPWELDMKPPIRMGELKLREGRCASPRCPDWNRGRDRKGRAQTLRHGIAEDLHTCPAVLGAVLGANRDRAKIPPSPLVGEERILGGLCLKVLVALWLG